MSAPVPPVAPTVARPGLARPRHGSGARARALAPAAALLVALGGCAGTGGEPGMLTLAEVEPWERGTLAHEDMQLVTDPLDATVDDHVYFSREASTGGRGAKGGGCGCN